MIIPTVQKSGFEDVPEQVFCTHPEHRAPTMLYVPPGKRYVHVCPSCGHTETIANSSTYLMQLTL